MIGDKIFAEVLSVRIIPNVEKSMKKALGLKPYRRSVAIITTTIDDVSYAALDEATKKTDSEVVYAHSMYGGSTNANTKLAGEFIGILAADDPESARCAVEAAIAYMEKDAYFISANEDDSIVYFAHCISRVGSYLSKEANVPTDVSMAYVIAPPLEAIVGLDAALKAADVVLSKLFAPPSETNFAGALLTGNQADCAAACNAFAEAVLDVARHPIETSS